MTNTKRTYRMIPSDRAGYAPGKYVVQYRDPEFGLWFPVGDPLTYADARVRLAERRAG